MPSWQAKVARRALELGMRVQRRRQGARRVTPDSAEEELERYALRMREEFERLANITPLPDWASFDEVDSPVRGEWVISERSEDQRVIFHVHGGAYLMGSPRTHRGLAAALARVGRARVFMPEYRLAPEHPFPAALDDAAAAYRWLLDEAGVDPRGVAISGDSAGGGLAVALMLEMRDEGRPLPACYVGLSPWTDLAGTGESVTERNDIDPWLDGEWLVPAGRGYAGEAALDDPRVSPLYGDLAGLPPMLVHAGTHEILYDDGRRLVERARAAGVEADFGSWEGMWHVFQAFPGIPESRWALREIGAFVRRHTEVAAAPTGDTPTSRDVDDEGRAA